MLPIYVIKGLQIRYYIGKSRITKW